MSTLSQFFEAWELFWQPTVAGMISGGLLGLLGVYIVIRRMVFLSASLSQVAGFGVALSFWAQISLGVHAAIASPILGASLASLLAIFAIMSDQSPQGARRDGLLGFVFLVGSAGTLAVGTRIVQEVQDIQSLLFGSAVAVLSHEFWMLTVMAVLIGGLHLWWWRGFVSVSLDAEDAKVRGMKPKVLETFLYVSIAVAIATSTRVLGALPTFAFSVLPAFAAINLASNVPRSMGLAVIFGVTSGFLGYLLAFMGELPVGASQTLVAALIAALAWIFRRR